MRLPWRARRCLIGGWGEGYDAEYFSAFFWRRFDREHSAHQPQALAHADKPYSGVGVPRSGFKTQAGIENSQAYLIVPAKEFGSRLLCLAVLHDIAQSFLSDTEKTVRDVFGDLGRIVAARKFHTDLVRPAHLIAEALQGRRQADVLQCAGMELMGERMDITGQIKIGLQ